MALRHWLGARRRTAGRQQRRRPGADERERTAAVMRYLFREPDEQAAGRRAPGR
ncbi:MAG: hypothetical protein MZV64_43495 [Ignavibacteriales bacterium]|nr:hypothetical protein [Ignavibacteriales bacterium]